MKDSWQYYDYLRRWWKLLLIGCLLGILAGYLIDQPKAHASSYTAITTATIKEPVWVFGPIGIQPPPPAEMTVSSGAQPTIEDATQALQVELSRLNSYTGSPVGRGEFIIDKSSVPSNTFKALILGGVVGALVVFGLIYLWDDARAYRKSLVFQT